jgi:hypothetical protein
MFIDWTLGLSGSIAMDTEELPISLSSKLRTVVHLEVPIRCEATSHKVVYVKAPELPVAVDTFAKKK